MNYLTLKDAKNIKILKVLCDLDSTEEASVILRYTDEDTYLVYTNCKKVATAFIGIYLDVEETVSFEKAESNFESVTIQLDDYVLLSKVGVRDLFVKKVNKAQLAYQEVVKELYQFDHDMRCSLEDGDDWDSNTIFLSTEDFNKLKELKIKVKKDYNVYSDVDLLANVHDDSDVILDGEIHICGECYMQLVSSKPKDMPIGDFYAISGSNPVGKPDIKIGSKITSQCGNKGITALLGSNETETSEVSIRRNKHRIKIKDEQVEVMYDPSSLSKRKISNKAPKVTHKGMKD